MKSNFLRLSYFAIAAAGMLTACNQENVSSDIANSGNVLSISVSQNDFSPVDAESRAVTDLTNRTTTFENGDKLGLYVVSNADGSYHYENVPFTYNGESWESESASTIYYYKNSDYIVYYPYIEDLQLTVGETGVSGAIKTVFESKSDFYTQNTADAYEAVDLMMAEVENPSDANVTFNLAHKFSMIEISVPVRKYITEKTYNGKKFEYNAPVKLEWTSPLTYGDNGVTPYAAGKGVYRFIVKPGTDVAVNIDGYVQYEEEPFNFSNDNAALTLTEGSFKHYKVTVEGISDQVTTRDLEVGDYYYSDGSIYPYGDQTGEHDLKNPMVEGCIGVIYEVTNGAPNTDWIHGSVLSLKNVSDESSAWDWDKVTIPDNIDGVWIDENYELIVSNNNGYYISNLNEAKNIDAIDGALKYESQCPSPANCSKWYLPSAGQLWQIVSDLGGYSTTSSDNIFTQVSGRRQYFEKINYSLTLVNGTQMVGNTRLWSCTLRNNGGTANAWTIEWAGDGDQFKMLSRQLNNSTHFSFVRPILSF